MTTLTIGMPAGSLADPNRGGNLVDLLYDAGFPTKGYDRGGPTTFPTAAWLYGWDGRPQEFGSQLGIGELDVAIAGDDWISERITELHLGYDLDIELEMILSLNRGGVRIVGILPGDDPHADLDSYLVDFCAGHEVIRVVSEMPYLALGWLRSALERLDLLERFSGFSVQNYTTPPRIGQGIVIYETWGKTEAKLKSGGADLGIEITQSGSALRNYGLKIIDEIMTSETGIWINPAVKTDAEKAPLLRMLLLNLYGSINAENKVLVVFNVANADRESIEAYLAAGHLFGDEPTVNAGRDFSEYSIQVDTSDPATPIARVRFELATRGAKNIDTLPLDSSIPDLGVLGF